MHHCAAQLGYTVLRNHRVVRQVVLLYFAGAWTLLSTEFTDGSMLEWTHVSVPTWAVLTVTARLTQQIGDWRDEGYEVRAYRTKAPLPELDAG